VLTGVLNNLTAVMGHVRNFLPSLIADLARMLSGRQPLTVRLQAATVIVLKICMVAVLGYIVSLEVVQLKAMSDKARAEACIERQKNAINFSSIDELLSPNGPARAFDKECKNL
jgi:hypothetical protein